MTTLPASTKRIITDLQSHGIEPILYGSQGVSLYIGAFKQFGDIDLLIDDSWLSQDWDELLRIMQTFGFLLHDIHEHKFVSTEDIHVGFASNNILVRDGITDRLEDVITILGVDDIAVRTLKPEAFKKAYEFSQKDGYRQAARGKKDGEVLILIIDYLKQNPSSAD
ncbi:MAG: hypothetical protein ABI220_02180 [Candidatus Saccharimonadales bacterium]